MRQEVAKASCKELAKNKEKEKTIAILIVLITYLCMEISLIIFD